MIGMCRIRRGRTSRLGGPLWLRSGVAALFVFCVNYVPIHLALEPHLHAGHGLTSGAVTAPAAKLCWTEAERDDGHAPHLASDHLLRLSPPMSSPGVGFDLASVATSVPLFSPQPQTPLFLTERQNPPGISLPDSLRPRAPPLA